MAGYIELTFINKPGAGYTEVVEAVSRIGIGLASSIEPAFDLLGKPGNIKLKIAGFNSIEAYLNASEDVRAAAIGLAIISAGTK